MFIQGSSHAGDSTIKKLGSVTAVFLEFLFVSCVFNAVVKLKQIRMFLI